MSAVTPTISNDRASREASREASQGVRRAAGTVDAPPVRLDEEWANALTHGSAALLGVAMGVWLVLSAHASIGMGLAIACAAYTASVVATFVASTLSHTLFQQPLQNTLRAWDQAMIYGMIAGTYTPIIYRFAPDSFRAPLLIAIWVAAFTGIAAKLLLRHRINNINTVGYLLLGWLPAIPMFSHVPFSVGMGMLIGGVVYSIGVVVLMNDSKAKYLHAGWHLLVMAAALVHCLTIRMFVIG